MGHEKNGYTQGLEQNISKEGLCLPLLPPAAWNMDLVASHVRPWDEDKILGTTEQHDKRTLAPWIS